MRNFDAQNTINNEFEKICDWLKINRLSLNIKKTKFMLFHNANKIIDTPQISIENDQIECVESFNFLGITLDRNLKWKLHTNIISGKKSRTFGILNKLKHFFTIEHQTDHI